MDVSVSMRPAAGQSAAVSAPIGASAPAGYRPLSVVSVPLAPGVAAPHHAPGAGVVLVPTTPRAEGAVTPLLAQFNSDDLIRQMNQQHFGGRPSGLGEAFQVMRQRYTSGESTVEADAQAVARGAIRQANSVIELYNQGNAQLGLPVVPLINDELLGLVGTEGADQGNPAGQDGPTGQAEVMPAWLSDP